MLNQISLSGTTTQDKPPTDNNSSWKDNPGQRKESTEIQEQRGDSGKSIFGLVCNLKSL